MLREINSEVLVADAAVVALTRADIADLKARAERNQRRRVRVCAHRNTDDAVHEMLIVMARGCYIRPHKHVAKSESFHVVEGELDVAVFNEGGQLTSVLSLGDYSSGARFYYRSDSELYHTVLIRSAVAVVHESTNGPFDPSNSVFAPWSPDENDTPAREKFLADLGETISRWSGGSRP